MDFLEKNKIAVVSVIIVGGLIWAYSTFFASDGVSSAEDLAAQEIGAEVLSLSTRLNSVKLDPALFTSKLYTYLQDLSTPIVPQPTGRANPFADI